MKSRELQEALAEAVKQTSLLLTELSVQNSMRYHHYTDRQCLDAREDAAYKAITKLRTHYESEDLT